MHQQDQALARAASRDRRCKLLAATLSPPRLIRGVHLQELRVGHGGRGALRPETKGGGGGSGVGVGGCGRFSSVHTRKDLVGGWVWEVQQCTHAQGLGGWVGVRGSAVYTRARTWWVGASTRR
eukprot:349842-Chlamydomonas_euryale.AAC.4